MKWYVKEFSKITNISVRTLHHYDDIGLLKPTQRTDSGYRLYSENDLQKLQCIVALKFFGFSLKKIITLFENDQDIFALLREQQEYLKMQINYLGQAHESIGNILSAQASSKSINWPEVTSLIGTYQMIKELKKTWVGKVFEGAQLQEYAKLRQKFTEQEYQDYNDRWTKLVMTIKDNLDKDPCGTLGQKLAKEWIAMVKELYGDRNDLVETFRIAYKGNKIPDKPYNPKMYVFMEKAFTYLAKKQSKADIEQMIEKLKQTWVGKVYQGKQLEIYANLRLEYGEDNYQQYVKQWGELVTEIKNNLDINPCSQRGQEFAQQWLDQVQLFYGNHQDLVDTYQKAYKENRIPHDPFNPQLYNFMEQAFKYLNRK